MVGEGMTEDEFVIWGETFRGRSWSEGEAAKVDSGELRVEGVGRDEIGSGAPSSLTGCLCGCCESGESGMRMQSSDGGFACSRQ